MNSHKASTGILGRFKAVVLSDISMSFGDWHRASAGLPADFAAKVAGRPRVPLFSVMVAFDRRVEGLYFFPLHLGKVFLFVVKRSQN